MEKEKHFCLQHKLHFRFSVLRMLFMFPYYLILPHTIPQVILPLSPVRLWYCQYSAWKCGDYEYII